MKTKKNAHRVGSGALVGRDRRKILAALHLAYEYQMGYADSWKNADKRLAAKARREAIGYLRLRDRMVAANNQVTGPTGPVE